MPTPMSIFAEIAERYGVDPSDDDAVEEFFRMGVPRRDRQAVRQELLLRQVPLPSRQFTRAEQGEAEKHKPGTKHAILVAGPAGKRSASGQPRRRARTARTG